MPIWSVGNFLFLAEIKIIHVKFICRRPFFVVIIFLLLYLNYTSIDAEVGAAPSEEKKPLPFKWKI
jgi:hypothetical protein